MSGLPNSGELDSSIIRQSRVEQQIREELRKNAEALSLARQLIKYAGVILSISGVPYAGSISNVAKLAIDIVAEEG
jgi:hypothetical protein